jgi:hypothetical protein
MKRPFQEEFNELSYYTLSHPDTVYFIHQHAVDVFQAQNATSNTKPIALIFSLVGLYLYLEKRYTGRQVQRAHQQLAQNKKTWPLIELPVQRGRITVSDVLETNPGQQRDEMIKKWCNSVWKAYNDSHKIILNLVKAELGV